MNLFDHEKEKYNIVHKFTGTSKDQVGYGRQINELRTSDNEFHKLWRAAFSTGKSFLEIGIGSGEILYYFEDNSMPYCGIDISDHIVLELASSGLNVRHMSCNKMEFGDNEFEVVQHLDGLEHVPIKWEQDTLSETVRVSSKYIFHANAMGDAYLDEISKKHGYDNVHINIKNEEEWSNFYVRNKDDLGYDIIHSEVISNTYYIVLEKR